MLIAPVLRPGKTEARLIPVGAVLKFLRFKGTKVSPVCSGTRSQLPVNIYVASGV
jgi:hypothetical protein